MKVYKIDIALAIVEISNEKKEMTPETCRAARALIGLSQAELAVLASVTTLTVRNYEAGKTEPSYKTWRTIRTVLERHVRFIDADGGEGPGVRLKREPGDKAKSRPR